MRHLIRLVETYMTEAASPYEGWWIKPDGSLHDCDHAHDWHHAQIALQDFPPEDDEDEDDEDDGGDVAISAAFMSGWIRGSYVVGQLLHVGWNEPPTTAAKNTLLAWMRAHATSFPKIEVAAGDVMPETFDDMRRAIGYVRKTV